MKSILLLLFSILVASCSNQKVKESFQIVEEAEFFAKLDAVQQIAGKHDDYAKTVQQILSSNNCAFTIEVYSNKVNAKFVALLCTDERFLSLGLFSKIGNAMIEEHGEEWPIFVTIESDAFKLGMACELYYEKGVLYVAKSPTWMENRSAVEVEILIQHILLDTPMQDVEQRDYDPDFDWSLGED